MSDLHLDQTSSEPKPGLFLEAWTRHIIASMNCLLAEQVEFLEESNPPSTSPNCWFHQTFPPLGGSLSLGMDREVALKIGAELPVTAALLEGNGSDPQSFVRILSRAAAEMATELSTRFKREVRAGALTQSDETPPGFKQASQLRLVVGGRSYQISVVIDLPPSARPLPTITPASNATFDSAPINTRNLDLLLDVELPISVSFGKAQLPLKDVVRLTTGSIIELSRSISEPVDIIVNNCTIARGEVVVVEGNYGVRIKQIVSKQERLRSVT
jgi:flagellar motor switch protein FliN